MESSPNTTDPAINPSTTPTRSVPTSASIPPRTRRHSRFMQWNPSKLMQHLPPNNAAKKSVIPRVVTPLLCLLVTLAVFAAPSPSLADANDDEMYCRFFQPDIIGDAKHVTQVTGIDGLYWFSDAEYDTYLYCWATWHCVALHFQPNGGNLVEMAESFGFAPGVHYWECEQPTVIPPS